MGFGVGLLQAVGGMPSDGVMELMSATNLPIVIGVYSTDNAVRIDANSGLPLPDLFLSAGYLSISSIQSADDED